MIDADSVSFTLITFLVDFALVCAGAGSRSLAVLQGKIETDEGAVSPPPSPTFFHLYPRTSLSHPLLVSLFLSNALGCLVYGMARENEECERERESERERVDEGRPRRVCLHRSQVRDCTAATLTSLSALVTADLGFLGWTLTVIVLCLFFWIGERTGGGGGGGRRRGARGRLWTSVHHADCGRLLALALALATVAAATLSLSLSLSHAYADVDPLPTALLLLTAAAVGTALRIALSTSLNGPLPWGTVTANILGTAVGTLLLLPPSAVLSTSLSLSLSLGLAGSLTTMSSHIASFAVSVQHCHVIKSIILFFQTYLPCHVIMYFIRYISG
jgi:fluoride ion exporter CrcB/FEX